MGAIGMVSKCFYPLLLLLLFVTGCSKGAVQADENDGSGSITASLAWGGSSSAAAKSVAAAPAGVVTMRFTVSAADMASPIQKTFSSSRGTGSIDKIPAGTGRTLTAEGLDATGAVTHKGSSKNLTVLAGRNTDAGAITMNTTGVSMNMDQTLSDGAQRTTLAFSALAMVTGNLGAQSFFPPGKVADYTGFQFLRDNDPDNMGHNTSFLTRVAYNVIYILNTNQFAKLTALAVAQQDKINQYGYNRFTLMKAFRRLLEGDIPNGSTGLNVQAVKAASKALYLIDGQISYDRAALYAEIINSLDDTQKAYLAAMKGKGWKSWPDITSAQVDSKMRSLPQGTSVAVMTYASDLYSWYNGSLEADVYFCPERHGTYFGSFFIKDAPAIGHEGYSIDEQLTATAGRALSDSSAGYVTPDQASLMSSLLTLQRNNLYAGSTNIVSVRTQIATLLRTLLTSLDTNRSVYDQVMALSGTYGELDGENNYYYASVMAQVYGTLTADQKSRLFALRKSIMSGIYSDGTPFDFSTTSDSYLYSSVITNTSVLTPYLDNAATIFFAP